MTTTVDQTQFVVGDVGVPFRATIIDPETCDPLDISSATLTEFHVRKPDATTDTWVASFLTDGTDGRIEYVTIAGDLDTAGTWLIEARIVAPGQDFRTITQPQFRVRGAI
jgi:hypothetical protein